MTTYKTIRRSYICPFRVRKRRRKKKSDKISEERNHTQPSRILQSCLQEKRTPTSGNLREIGLVQSLIIIQSGSSAGEKTIRRLDHAKNAYLSYFHNRSSAQPTNTLESDLISHGTNEGLGPILRLLQEGTKMSGEKISSEFR